MKLMIITAGVDTGKASAVTAGGIGSEIDIEE
jgi:hypothetical protein